MAYGLKYYGTLYSLKFQNKYKFEILEDDYSDSSEEITMTSNGIILEYPGDEEDPFNPVIGSKLTIYLLCEEDFKFTDLYSSTYREHLVRLYRNDTLFWQGWIIPELFSEPYVAAPYEVSITARCGLGELKDYDLLDDDADDDDIPTIISPVDSTEKSFVNLYEILKYCLSTLLETDLPFNDVINIFPEDAESGDTYSPLDQTYVHLDNFSDNNWYEVLQDVLITLGARLYQSEAGWWLVREEELNDTLRVREWDLSADTFTLTETKVIDYNIGGPGHDQIIKDDSPQLTLEPGYKSVAWVQDLNIPDSILENYDFATGDLTGWTQVTSGDWEIRTNQKDGGYLAIGTGVATSSDPFAQAISQTISDLVTSSTITFKVTVNFGLFQGTNSTADVYIQIKFTATDSTVYYYSYTDDDTYSWTTTETSILLSNLDADADSLANSDFSYDFVFPALPDDGDLEILLSPATTGVLLGLRSIELIPVYVDDSSSIDTEVKTTYTINSNNVSKHDDIDSVSAPVNSDNNISKFTKNGFRYSDDTSAIRWRNYDEENGDILLQLTSDFYAEIFDTAKFNLNIAIFTEGVRFDSGIIDYRVLSKKYICTSATITFRDEKFSGFFYEMFTVTVDTWILANGYWDNSGVWDDDSEWIDE